MHIFELVVAMVSACTTAVSIVVGARQVRLLRRKTGDNSAVTRVLGGELLDRPRRKAA